MAVDAGRLLVRLDGKMWRDLRLVPGVITIGREPSNALPLPDPRVSRRHAELRLESQGLTVTDLGSVTGTKLDGERLLADQPHTISGGATFLVGPFALTYLTPEQIRDGYLERAGSPSVGETASPNGQEASPPPLTALPPRPARPQEPIPRPARPPQGPASRYLDHLPAIFGDTDFLGRYLLIFEALWEPLEQRQDRIDMYFDPRTCPASFLPWLASWLGLTFSPNPSRSATHDPINTLRLDSPESRVLDESRRRDVLAAALDLYRWRGTRHGLERVIELSTGVTPHISDDPSDPYVFHIRINVPPDFPFDEELVHGLIRAHKPVHAGYTMQVVR